MTIRLAVAGLGAVAQTVHLPLLARRGDLFTIAAVADASPSVLARIGARYGVPAERQVSSVGELLALDDLDAVMLLTSGSHGADAARCRERGLPVFVEKPLALNRSEIQQLIDGAGEKPDIFLAYMKQYDPATARLEQELADLAADPASAIRNVHVEVLHPSDAAQLAFANLGARPTDIPEQVVQELSAATAATVRAAIGDPGAIHAQTYAGVILGSIIHDISLLRGLIGSPTSIELVRTWGERPGSVQVVATLPGGIPLVIDWHYLPDYPTYTETISIHHGTGRAELVFPCPYQLNAPSELRLTRRRAGMPPATEEVVLFRSAVEEFENELVAFAAMVNDGVAPKSGPAEGLQDTITGQQIYAAYARFHGLEMTGEATEF